MVFSSVGSLSQHLMSEHSPASNTCNWKMCTYWDNDSDYCKLESHIISHVYQVCFWVVVFFSLLSLYLGRNIICMWFGLPYTPYFLPHTLNSFLPFQGKNG